MGYVYTGMIKQFKGYIDLNHLGEKKIIELGVIELRHKVEALQEHCGNDVSNLERVLL